MKIVIQKLETGRDTEQQLPENITSICGWRKHEACNAGHIPSEYPIPGGYRIVSVSLYEALDTLRVCITRERNL